MLWGSYLVLLYGATHSYDGVVITQQYDWKSADMCSTFIKESDSKKSVISSVPSHHHLCLNCNRNRDSIVVPNVNRVLPGAAPLHNDDLAGWSCGSANFVRYVNVVTRSIHSNVQLGHNNRPSKMFLQMWNCVPARWLRVICVHNNRHHKSICIQLDSANDHCLQQTYVSPPYRVYYRKSFDTYFSNGHSKFDSDYGHIMSW